MKREFTLLLALMAALYVVATGVNVPVGENGKIKAAVNAAAEGDTLILATGNYTETSHIEITKPLTIMAAEGSSPVLLMSARFQVKAPLTLQGLTLNGSQVAEAIRLLPANNGTLASLSMRNCTIQGYRYGNSTSRIVRVYNTDQTAPYVDSISIDNCLFRIDGMIRTVDAEKAEVQFRHLRITRSTFDGGAGTNRILNVQSTQGATIESAVIDHCTFYNSIEPRAVYLANIDGAKVSNCILMNAENVEGNQGFCLYGAESAITNCVVYNAPVYGSPGSTNKVRMHNPYFMDAAAGDFRLYANSPAIGMATDGTNVGDPRWEITDQEYNTANEPYVPYKKPYSMAPTTHSVKILWQMNEENKPTEAIVRYGTNRDNLDMEIKSSEGWNVEDEGYVHIITLTGLQPFTRYYFTVGDGTRWYADTCSTKTAPEQGSAFRIFTISDIHGNARNNWINMQDTICALNADISLMNGDFVSSKGNDRNWNKYFFTPGAQFLSQVPLMSSVGNHETGDPFTYRWASYYDYFHQFSHGTPEDTIKDPRGEAYFHFTYGNADIVMLNLNGDPSSPDFLPGSKQYEWADSVLNACDRPWIIVCHHVGVHTTGYHGQWADEPRQVGVLFEKYAAKGKRIISLSGDDHSFEHLYKDGVHYVRPGCGRDANYEQQKQLNDYKYSIFYKRVSCFSTLDMAADASSIALTAYDSVGNIFYNYTFLHDNEVVTPSVSFVFTEREIEDSVRLQWCAFDPAGNARVSLYYSQNGNLTTTDGMTLIAGDFDSQTTKCIWHARDIMPKGTYYVYAAIVSGENTYLSAPLAVTLLEDTTPPPPPTDMKGNIVNGHYHMYWQNPTHLVHITTPLTSFADGLDNMQTVDDDGAKMTIQTIDGSLKADYNLTAAWSTTSADYVFDTPANAYQTPFLSFRLKGNGSNTALRLVCSNSVYGSEDWWYTEAYNLSSVQWENKVVDMRTLSPFTWHANSTDKNRCEALTRISFAISDGNAISGSFYIDDIMLSGDIFPAPDYLETVIMRKEDGFSVSSTDGIEVYRGNAEEFTDANADTGKRYYYSAFAYDDRSNASPAAASAQWCTDNPSAIDSLSKEKRLVRKTITDGKLLITLPNGRCYNAIGQEMKQIEF